MNIIKKYTGRSLWLAGLMLTTLIAGCSGGGSSSDPTVTDVPTVVETAPAGAAIDVALNSKVVVTFSEEMDEASFTDTSFTVIDADRSASLVGNISYDSASKTATFTPSIPFTLNTTHTATVTTAVKSATGVALAANYVWNFTTGATTDITAPTVTSTNPADVATGFTLNSNVTANFSERLDQTTVTSSTFTLAIATTSVPGAVSYSNKVATFNPTNELTANTKYTATLTTGITDLAGNALAANKVWSFTTGDTTAIAQGPAPVNLRTAGDFVILTKTGITNTGAHLSKITGNIGSSPIAASAMKDVWCSEMVVPSKIYGVDDTYTVAGYEECFIGGVTNPAAKTYVDGAVGDMLTAYNDAAGRTDYKDADGISQTAITEEYAGNLSGKTLAPGLYKWSTNVLINDDVTLDGGPNDVWIFQIADNVIQANGTKVLFSADGALPKNVFWQVGGGTGVTIGTTATFQGVVLAKAGVSVNTSATVNGRLLVETAVTLDQNAVTQPAL